jgi:hypothetical protein
MMTRHQLLAALGEIVRVMMLALAGLRHMSVRCFAASCQAIVYEAHGPPKDVLQLREHPVQDVGPHDVGLDILAVGGQPATLACYKAFVDPDIS